MLDACVSMIDACVSMLDVSVSMLNACVSLLVCAYVRVSIRIQNRTYGT